MPSDHAWLIWLDKLEAHGRELLSTCEPLASLLADESVLKVGVGSTADARKLLEWSPAPEPVRGVVDLNALSGGAMADADAICMPAKRSHSGEAVLGRTLPKRKHKGKKQSRASKRAHWRAIELTGDMKQYAAADAAAGLAVWQTLLGQARGSIARIALEGSAVDVELSSDDIKRRAVRRLASMLNTDEPHALF